MKNIKPIQLICKSVFSLMIIIFSFWAVQTSQAQAAAIKKSEVPSAKTIVREKHASFSFSGVCDPKSIKNSDKIESYDVLYKDKKVISVSVTKSSAYSTDNFYQIDFAIPGTTKKAFITGLTADNVASTQNALINKYANRSDFDIEDLNYIDAEKLGTSGVDSQLCWAAQASNMLTYSGWAKKAGFSSEDSVFKTFADNFSDTGSICENAMSWFFNGIPTQNICKTQSSGAFLNDYTYESVYKGDIISNYTGKNGKTTDVFFKNMTKALKKGNAVGVDVGWIDINGKISSGHAVTLFGYIYNTAYKNTSLNYYDAMIFADSDSNKGVYSDRSKAPNRLNIHTAKPYLLNGSLNTLMLDKYGDGAIFRCHILAPYSDDTPCETDSRATKNRLTSFDLTSGDVFVSSSKYQSADDYPYIPSGKELYVSLAMKYAGSLTSSSGFFGVSLNVFDSNGTVVFSDSAKPSTFLISNLIWTNKSTNIILPALENGTYTIKGHFEVENAPAEAYYYNNYFEKTFTVRDSIADESAMGINLAVDSFGDNPTATGRITYDNKSYIEDSGLDQSLLISYNENGTWSEWTEIFNSASDATTQYKYKELPDKIDIEKKGAEVKLCLTLFSGTGAPASYYSNPCELKYQSVSATSATTNTEFTKLLFGASSLAGSEAFEYTISNNSTYDAGAITGMYNVYAKDCQTGEQSTLTELTSFELEYGKSTGSQRLSSWSSDAKLHGKNEIYLNLYDSASRKYNSYLLGTVYFAEKPSATVTTCLDVSDEYDGSISLREAINYIQEGKVDNTQITLNDSLGTGTTLTEPIKITGNITINGYYSHNQYDAGYKLCSIYGGVFEVSDGAELSLNAVVFSNTSSAHGGAILAENAKCVRISHCRFDNCRGALGGAIYSMNSQLLIGACQFNNCNSINEGAAVYAGGGSNCHMVNCLVYQNKSEKSIIENNRSTVSIVSTTITDNSTSGSGLVVNGNSDTRILSSILTGNDTKYDASGEVNLYGCAYGKISTSVKTYGNTKKLSKSKLFFVSNNKIISQILFESADDEHENSYLYLELYDKKHAGVNIAVADGTLHYSTHLSSPYEDSGIPAQFSESAYKIDMYGSDRGTVYGCDSNYFYETTVGKSPKKITTKQISKKNSETAMGRAVSDAFRLITKADVALVKTSSIMKGVKKGKLTKSNLQDVIPDSDFINRKKIKGKDLKKIFEKVIDYMIKDKKKYRNKTLQISGATIKYKQSAKKGKRIKSIKIGEKKIKSSKKYNVVMDYYTAEDVAYMYGEFNNSGKKEYDWYDALLKYFNKSASYIKKSISSKRLVKS